MSFGSPHRDKVENGMIHHFVVDRHDRDRRVSQRKRISTIRTIKGIHNENIDRLYLYSPPEHGKSSESDGRKISTVKIVELVVCSR